MKSQIIKALVLIMLALAFTLPAISYAYADPFKTVTAVLNQDDLSKQISIPQGYRPHIAKLQLVGSGTDEFTMNMVVGTEQTKLSWPAAPSRSLPLPAKDWNGVTTVPVTVSAPPVFPFLLNVEITCVKQDRIK
jgi:hypothetical protein